MSDGKIAKGVYEHFKGNRYLFLGEAVDSDTRRAMVLYLALYEPYDIQVRFKDEFLEEVDRPEIPYKGPRFKFIKEVNW